MVLEISPVGSARGGLGRVGAGQAVLEMVLEISPVGSGRGGSGRVGAGQEALKIFRVGSSRPGRTRPARNDPTRPYKRPENKAQARATTGVALLFPRFRIVYES